MSNEIIEELTFFVGQEDRLKIHPDPRHLSSRIRSKPGYGGLVSVDREEGTVKVWAYAGFINKIKAEVMVYLLNREIMVSNIMNKRVD